MKTIDTIIFDLGGTLIDYVGIYDKWPEMETPGFNATHRFLEQQGVLVPELKAFKSIGFDLLPTRWSQATSGLRNLTVSSLLSDILVAFDIALPEQSLLEDAADRYQRAICAGAKPIPGGKEILSIFRKQSVKLGLVSNTMFTGKNHIKDMEKFGLDAFFEAMVFSADSNMWKPNIAPFTHVMDLLDAGPSSTLFIGDDPAVDVVGGRSAGLYTVHFRSNDRFPSPDGITPDAAIHTLAALPPLIDQLNA